MFHRCPAKRHTQSNDPSNGTFVASNVRIHECTPPRGGDHDSPSFARLVLCTSRKSLYIREVYKRLVERPSNPLRIGPSRHRYRDLSDAFGLVDLCSTHRAYPLQARHNLNISSKKIRAFFQFSQFSTIISNILHLVVEKYLN